MMGPIPKNRPIPREVCVSQIVSVSSLKGGVGKTSVALGLASAALHRGVDTLVVDLDPHGDASTGLGLSATHGPDSDAAEVLSAPGRRRAVARAATPAGWLRRSDAASGTRLDVLAGSARCAAYEHLRPNRRHLARLREALDGASGYELVLIDCPPALNTLTMIAWAASDKVLSVAEPSLFSVAGTERTMRAIARFESESSLKVRAASVVVNKVQEDWPEHRYRIEEMEGMFGRLLVSPVIPQSPVWQQIQGSAHPVHAWGGAEARALAEAYDAILVGLLRS